MNTPTIHRDVFALVGVILEELDQGETHSELRRALAVGSIRLLDDITLAISGFDRVNSLDSADAELAMLRTRLELARASSILDESCFLEVFEQVELVGRQLGGWLGKLRREGTGRSTIGT